MATDFSALCPLFNTGVYSELTIPGPISTATGTASTTVKLAGVIFGRSVIVTAAYLAKLTALATASLNPTVKLFRQTSWASAGTCFASFEISKTTTVQILRKYLAFTQAAAKTFTATNWLTVRTNKTVTNGKSIAGVVVRYKEK